VAVIVYVVAVMVCGRHGIPCGRHGIGLLFVLFIAVLSARLSDSGTTAVIYCCLPVAVVCSVVRFACRFHIAYF